ncbi:TSUP family transporter [Pseudoflavonifractor sp. CLA-AP-H29]|uniref:Probable membrane transporter protein n=1 Tax=Pseudoflavonifractor intestinihominis TaxID=3133171 RepID=A0ABV1E5R0_9FIRM
MRNLRIISAAGASARARIVKGAAGGACIGLICGFFGAGGGMMMLMVLTVLLGYELKTAVGTSVFVMTFSALTGAVSHFALGSPPRPDLLVLCVVFTLAWAQIAAKIAARADARLLNRLTGVILTLLGLVLVVITFL